MAKGVIITICHHNIEKVSTFYLLFQYNAEKNLNECDFSQD